MGRKKDDGVFCIAVSWFHFAGIDSRVYEICRGPRDCDCVEITRKEAREIIDEHLLVKVYESEDGCIYDTPDRTFHERWNGYFKFKDDEIFRIIHNKAGRPKKRK